MTARGKPAHPFTGHQESSPTPKFWLVQDLDRLTAAEIVAAQQENLLATVAAILRSPAAAAHWPGIAGVKNAADLSALPLFAPAAFGELCPPQVEDLVLDSRESGLVLRSSGTSGRRKVLYHSWAFNDRVAFLGARGLRSAVTHPPKRVANCLFAAELNGAFSFAQDVTQELAAQSFPIGSSMAVDELLDVISEHRIDTLMAAPAMFADLVADQRHLGFLDSLRTFLFIGENLGATRAGIIAAAMPAVEVKSLSYSTSETGPIGYQCRVQTDGTHHLHEDALVVEVVDADTGAALPEGQEGEVVVSTLTDTGMALLRYRIGDRGVLDTRPCACGSRAARLTLTGRVANSFNVDGATISRELVMAQLDGFGITDPADCQFQIVRAERGFTVVLLISDRHATALTADAVLARLRGGYHLGRVFRMPGFNGFELRAVPLAELVRDKRGKIPFFVEH